LCSSAYTSSTQLTDIAPLSPGTTYRYRIAIRDSSNNWIYGNDVSFVTTGGGSDQFAVQTQAATNVGNTTATLNGLVTGLGSNSSAMVYLEYRKGSCSYNSFYIKNVSSPESVSWSAFNLLPNTTYQFRIKAKAGASTWVYGEMMTFTTN
jgi:subtilisin